jgi:hypothetical protein
MTVDATLAPLANSLSTIVSAGLIIWFIKRGFDKQDGTLGDIKKRMDCFEASQHACQLSNAKEFATKEEVKAIWDKQDDHEKRISRIEGRK